MKKYFFLLALASLTTLACDPADGDLVTGGDAGAGPDALSPRPDVLAPGSDALGPRQDVLAPRSDSLSPGCPVPEPRVKSMWGAAVTTTPRGGYRTLQVVPSCSSSQNPSPKNCASPVDGFSDGTSWCCVATEKNADGTYRSARATVQCFASPMAMMPTKAPGNVALCSPEGKFVGWDCMDGS